MAKCNPRTHVLAPPEDCKRERIRHRSGLAGTPTGYKKDGCRCCDCKLWNTNRSRRERGMPELPTLQSAERPATPTKPAPARVRPERAPKPATAPRKPVQRETPRADEPAEDLAEDLAEEPDEEPAEERSGWSNFKLNAFGFTPIQPIRSQITRPMTAPITAPIPEPKRQALVYVLRSNTHGMCTVWIDGINCACAVDGRYMVRGSSGPYSPACWEHYDLIRKAYPNRVKYQNQAGNWSTPGMPSTEPKRFG